MVVEAAAEHCVHLEEARQRRIDLFLALRQSKVCRGGFQVHPDLIETLDGVAHLLSHCGQLLARVLAHAAAE